MSGIPSLVLLVPARAADIGRRSAANRDTLFHVAGSTLWARAGDVRRLPAVTGRLVVALYGARGQTMTYGDAFDSVFADDPDGGAALDLVKSVLRFRRIARADMAALGITIETWERFGYRLQIAPARERRAPSLRLVASAEDWMRLPHAAGLGAGAVA